MNRNYVTVTLHCISPSLLRICVRAREDPFAAPLLLSGGDRLQWLRPSVRLSVCLSAAVRLFTVVLRRVEIYCASHECRTPTHRRRRTYA